jgi:hypothetical protein
MPTSQTQQPLKRLTPITRALTRDTACGDMAVTIHRWWPPPHVVAALSSRKVKQREVSSISPLSMRTPRHRSALPLSAVDTLSVPAASVHLVDSTLHPRAPPSHRGAR